MWFGDGGLVGLVVSRFGNLVNLFSIRLLVRYDVVFVNGNGRIEN
jgi:hypothetical protein